MVVDQEEEPRPHRARRSGMGHEGTDEDVPDPALVGRRRLIPAEGAPVAQELGTGEPAPAELLGQRALGEPYPVARSHDLADVGGRSRRLLDPQTDRLLEEGGIEPGPAPVGPGLVAQAVQALGSVPADPAVDRVAADRPRFAVGADMFGGRQLADQEPPLSGGELWIERLGDQVEAPEGAGFAVIRGPRTPRCWGYR